MDRPRGSHIPAGGCSVTRGGRRNAAPLPTNLVHLSPCCSPPPQGRRPHLSPRWMGVGSPGPCQTFEETSCFGMSDVCVTQILLPNCEAGARAGPSPVTPARSDSSVSNAQGEGSRATWASVPHRFVLCIATL